MNVEDRLAYLISEHKAVISKPEEWPVALGYAPWVEEVWTNLLSNAIKYGGTPPVLALGAGQNEQGMLYFSVQDNGDGLTPEEQKELFIEFKRFENIRASGHGLGLAITKRIIKKLNGIVEVESAGEPGKGSLFRFILPKADLPKEPRK
jgi:signal transduction histidine kinase